MIRIAVCDDNKEFLKMFAEKIRMACQNVLSDGMKADVGLTFDNAKSVLAYLKTQSIDVLFLDIDMPEMSGFDLARIICKSYPQMLIVFVSAYDNFVYDAFEFSPFAYLRKNHLDVELNSVLSRIQDRITNSNKTMFFVSKEGDAAVSIKNIVYFESAKNYYKAHLADGNTYECRGTITDLEENLASFGFFRIHSAFLINMEYVTLIGKNRSVFLHNDIELPVAPKRMQEFKDAYLEYTRRFFGV